MIITRETPRSGTEQNSPRARPRLRLKPKAPVSGYVDGAWWPHSDDLAVELLDLLTVLSVRLGTIERVIYNLGDWAKAPNDFQFAGRAVLLGGYSGQPVDTIQVIGAQGRKLVLLVIAPSSDRDRARAAMMAASVPEDSSTIEDLLRDMIENDG